jgi:hypothetical protein
LIKKEYFPEATPKTKPEASRSQADYRCAGYQIRARKKPLERKKIVVARKHQTNSATNPSFLSIYWNAVPVYLHSLKKFK